MPPDRRETLLNGTMAYESAADEMVFIVGPFLVGLLATAIAPWVAIAGAAVLTSVFVTAFALHPTGRLQPGTAEQRSEPGARPRAGDRPQLMTVVAGTLGVGIFFGATLTSLTGFLAATGDGDRAGLLYGVMGIGSAALALGSAALPQRFTPRARWLVFGSLLLAAAIGYATARSETGLLVALAVLGFGIGPTLVALYSLAATLSPAGRSATTMTMLGSAVVVGQAVASAVTGALVDRLGPETALRPSRPRRRARRRRRPRPPGTGPAAGRAGAGTRRRLSRIAPAHVTRAVARVRRRGAPAPAAAACSARSRTRRARPGPAPPAA